MYRPRIIPVLLLRNFGLVKSHQFKDYRYIGDPINAVKIFNDLRAHELVFLDILASKENRLVSLDLVSKIGEEANMPFSVGGGIKTLEDIRKILSAGAEKVILNTIAGKNPQFVRLAAETFGSSTIAVCMDVKKKRFSNEEVWIYGGSKSTGMAPVEYAQLMESKGAGEIIVQSVKKDGTMQGYDLDLIRSVSETVSIPVVALGGAGSLLNLSEVHKKAYANGLAAGSLFVFHGPRRGVLINYPTKQEINALFSDIQ
jgi:imidazole glycerol-phosphate synthase subunit HisF